MSAWPVLGYIIVKPQLPSNYYCSIISLVTSAWLHHHSPPTTIVFLLPQVPYHPHLSVIVTLHFNIFFPFDIYLNIPQSVFCILHLCNFMPCLLELVLERLTRIVDITLSFFYRGKFWTIFWHMTFFWNFYVPCLWSQRWDHWRTRGMGNIVCSVYNVL